MSAPKAGSTDELKAKVPGLTFDADVTKIVPPKLSSFKHNIPDIQEGHGATGIIATKSRPTKEEVLLALELKGGTIGNDVRIADLGHTREFLEARDFTVDEATTIIVTTEGDIIVATINKNLRMKLDPADPEKPIYLLMNKIQIRTHQTKRPDGYHCVSYGNKKWWFTWPYCIHSWADLSRNCTDTLVIAL